MRAGEKGKETEKSLWVIDHNHNMGAVDLKDQLALHLLKRNK